MNSTRALTNPRQDDARTTEAKVRSTMQGKRIPETEAVLAAAIAKEPNLADVQWASGERNEIDIEVVVKKRKEQDEAEHREGESQADLASTPAIELVTLAGSTDFSTLVAEAGQFSAGAAAFVSTELGEVDGTYHLFGDDDGGGLLLLGLGLIVIVGGAILLLDDGNKNDPPSITSAATASIAENSPITTVVLDVNATDPDKNDEITFSLTGTDAAAFTIDADDGEIRFKASPNFETKSSYTFTVVATDEDENTVQQNVTVTVTNMNEAPTVTTTSPVSINENVATSTVVFTPTSSDPESGAITYSLQGADAAAFNINPTTGAVTFVASPNFETKSSYAITLVGTDPGGVTGTQNVTINVNNVNEAPTVSTTSPLSFNENVAVGTAVFTPTSSDPEGTTVTYSLTGADASAFAINPTTGAVTFASSPNFEAKSSYTITLVGTDAGGATGTQNVTININNVAEGPTIAATSPVSINENVAAGTVVLTPTGSDPEGGAITYSLLGADAGSFNINPTTGAVSFVSSPDFETKSSYAITLLGTDPGGLTGTTNVVVNINDLTEIIDTLSLAAAVQPIV